MKRHTIDMALADGPLQGQTHSHTTRKRDTPDTIDIKDDTGTTHRYRYTGGHELIDGEVVLIYKLDTEHT